MTPFSRPPKSVAEIAALPAPGTTQCLEFLRAGAGSLTPETLVHVAREAIRVRDGELHGLAVMALLGSPAQNGTIVGGHCEAIIRNRARAFGFDEPADLEDFRGDCLSRLVEAIHPGPKAKEYLEHRFFDCFLGLCVDVGRGLKLRRKTVRLAPGEANGYEVEWLESLADPDEDSTSDNSDDPVVSSETKVRLHRAILRLPPRQRTAVQLRLLLGLPVTGDGPRTVVSIMRVSETNVYKLLDKAKRTLRKDPDLRGLWP